jgi:hypothetical protein
MSSRATDTDAAITNIERQLSDGRRFRRISRAIEPSTSAALTKVEIVSHTFTHPPTKLSPKQPQNLLTLEEP